MDAQLDTTLSARVGCMAHLLGYRAQKLWYFLGKICQLPGLGAVTTTN